MTRQEALLAGASTYLPDHPCKHGHHAPRYTTSRHCVECSKAKARTYYHRNGGSERAKVRHIERKYGLSKEEFEALLHKQECKCAICRNPLKVNSGNGGDGPCIDHCHDTGKVRGILCNNCNRGLGMFKDNTEYLTSAISYLREQHGPRTSKH